MLCEVHSLKPQVLRFQGSKDPLVQVHVTSRNALPLARTRTAGQPCGLHGSLGK